MHVAQSLSHLVQKTLGLQWRVGHFCAGFCVTVITVHKNSIFLQANEFKGLGGKVGFVEQQGGGLISDFAGFAAVLSKVAVWMLWQS